MREVLSGNFHTSSNRLVAIVLVCLLPVPEAWHDIGFRFSVCSCICPAINICNHPRVDRSVRVCNSESLRDNFTRLGTNIKHHRTM